MRVIQLLSRQQALCSRQPITVEVGRNQKAGERKH